MFKRISILFLLLILSGFTYAQTAKYNAPVKWEIYKVSDREVSILLPKLPTLISDLDICRQEESSNYTAYAENVVYSFTITAKSKQKVPGYCTNGKKFDNQNFADRLKEIKLELKTEKEREFNQNGLEVIKIENKIFAYWLINDFDNKRYFELRTTDTDETNENIKNFVGSLKIEKNPSGIEIGKGAFRTLGDENMSDNTEVEDKDTINSDEEMIKLRIVAKPRANYTDAARQKNTQGTVSLRVTFLGSGGIGNISVLNNLPHGLTEQAIVAAMKIAFVPMKKNGKLVSVSKIVQYNFLIY